jgi:Mrp family chromosome partitioning ATPase
MSRNYELLRQLEELSSQSSDPFPLQRNEQRTKPIAGPKPAEPTYTPLPKIDEIPVLPLPESQPAAIVDDEIARLVESLVLSRDGRELRSIVFCGIEDNDASSLACANAGRGLAARSELVCLVDVNVRERNLSRHLGIPLQPTSKDEARWINDPCFQLEKNLWFAGPSLITNENGGLLSVDEITNVMGRLRDMFNYVLFDTQSIGASRDAALFGHLADGAVLVVEASVTRKQAARKAKEFLESSAVSLVGTILNNRSFPIPESIYRRL